MSGGTSCPTGRDLLRLTLGQIGKDDATLLRRHIDQCDQCREQLRTLGVEGTQFQAALETEETATKLPGIVAPPPPAPLKAAGVDPLIQVLLKPAQAADEIGRLGNYRILKVLGSGAAGVVFHAEDIQLKRPVALKLMKPVERGQEEVKQRFLREGQLAAALEHEHVLTIYQVGEDDGVPYLAMQLLHGETLDDRLKREPQLDILEVLRIAQEIGYGLAAAHERGLVHRDVKPANIWLEGKQGRVKIVDFGLARAITDDVQLTKTGTVMGTPAYMAPEQARGVKVDHRCDLFSLGGVIYRMATGRTPFQAEDTMSMLLALAHEQPRPLTAFNEEVPEALQGLVFWMLAKHPDARPQSVEEILEVLEAIQNSLTAEPEEVQPRSNTLQTVLIMLLLAGLAFAAVWFSGDVMRALKR